MTLLRHLRLWDHLPFIARLLATATLALLVAGSVMLLVSANLDGQAAREDLQHELSSDLETLPAALAEVVVVGDFATLQQTLDNYVQRPRVTAISFRDNTGVVIGSKAVLGPPRAPQWFSQLLEFQDLTGQAQVRVGGHAYGSLSLTLSAQNSADRAWRRLLLHLGVLTLAVGMDFLGIWLVLRTGLRPLDTLRHGALALAAGRLEQRLPVAGSPELRSVIAAFNHMAHSLENTQEQILRRNVEQIRFSEIAAHHLQEPSRRLVAYAQRLQKLLDKQLTAPDARLSLGFIVQEANRQRRLLHDIELYLAAPQPIGELRSQNLNAVLTDILRGMDEQLSEASATLNIGVLPPVTLDLRRLQTILKFAIDNAIRFRHPDRALRLTIGAAVEGDRVILRIEDNGTGVAPEYRERVFRVFEQLFPRNDDGSTGIGLSVIRRIAESTEGNAWLEDSPEQGVTLVMDLPLGTVS